MNNAEFQLRGVSDPRLAVHATSAFPAWLWSIDGTQILWANPVGAVLFGAANSAELAKQNFGPADPHRRQMAQLAGRLPLTGAVRLERLRGFGAAIGTLQTCGCTRLDFADGQHGVLIVATERASRNMPPNERLQRLVEGIDTPVAAFTGDGTLAGASDAARAVFGFRNLSEAGLDQAQREALTQGRAETQLGTAHMVLQRIGSGTDVGLIALITPQETISPPSESETTAQPYETPAGITWVDEFVEPLQQLRVEAPHREQAPESAIAEPAISAVETHGDAPSPDADDETTAAIEIAPAASIALEPVAALSFDEPAPEPRRLPLRFTWQMDAQGRFALGSDEFTHLIGARTTAGFGRLWSEIAETFGIDPEGQVATAIAARTTWSGITLNWPVDGEARLPVELSGLPVFDRAGNFAGYHGFGVCRDLDGLTRLATLRRHELSNDPPIQQPVSAGALPEGPIKESMIEAAPTVPETPQSPHSIAAENSPKTDLETPVETPKNVLPFRPISEPKAPVLTPVENSAFNELARQLSARLDHENGASETAADLPATPEEPRPEVPAGIAPANLAPEWLTQPEPPPRGETRRDRALLDLLPLGVLIYRLDRLLYANPAFLARMGYDSLHALEEAGGLDALYVEPGVSSASSTSDTGTPVTISATQDNGHAPSSATQAHLFTIAWDGESALALIGSGAPLAAADVAAADVAAAITEPDASSEPSAVGQANAEELGAILDTTTDGIVMFDAEGRINACNRSAEALFGYDGNELVQLNLTELFAPESQRVVMDYLQSTGGADFASLLDHGRDVLGRVRKGGIVPLSMTMGRTRADGPNFFAVFRDLSHTRKSENELQQAQRLVSRAANSKADMLARISHEIRTPLNAIIGFAEVMIAERFGGLGNERYVEYMKDIRASGERVIAIINDLNDLTRIETGKLDLAFADQNLNDVVESCVAVMQPQANRERIIIRTSLAHMLPPVVADQGALRQITLNLIGNSIHLANAGGQVIVSTALSDFGEVVLRVRDTGHGLNDNEVAAALEPFRTQAPSDQASDGVSLSLTKALVEANRAQFNIRTGPRSGTLVEVVFSHTLERA